jgi:hypothetical protein
MAWSSLASNQTVSFTNLKDAVDNGVFSIITSVPTSLEQITKSDASTYINIDTAASPYSTKSSGQLVVKSDLVAINGFLSHGRVASGKGIKVVDDPTVAGLLCTDTAGEVPRYNYRFSATVEDNNIISTLNYNGTGYTVLINSVRAYFTVKTNGTYTVTANVSINGQAKGSGSVTGTYTTSDLGRVIIPLSSSVDFGLNVTMFVDYT